MLSELFSKQKELLNFFFDALDLNQVEKAFEKIKECKGSLILSGVGKSGSIAEKIAKTLASTGTRAYFLSPSEALHGDLGKVAPQDLFLAFSKSGESEELLSLMPHIERRGVFRIAIVSQQKTSLEQASNMAVLLPLQKELCPYDLVPSTSTAIQLIFGDSLAIALMQEKNFSISDFAANHPGGLLGRKITKKVSDIMLQGNQLPKVSPESLLMHALCELSEKRCGCLLVVEEDKLLGIFTDGDLRRALEKRGTKALETPMRDLMNSSPQTTEECVFLFEAMAQMEKDPTKLITVLPVMRGERLIGIVRMHDILQQNFYQDRHSR